MRENSRIRFNPVTKEIELEGSEKFVKAYFEKLQEMMSRPLKAIAAEQKVEKKRPVKKAKKEIEAIAAPPRKKTVKVVKEETGQKKATNIDAVVALIQGSADGISTTELKEETGLAERQIWSIVNRATKQGKIRKVKRGIYGAV